jgi:phosphomannomutase
LQAGGGIEVTASHNPIDYNGMKPIRENSKPISSDTGLLEIKKLAEENAFSEVDTSKRGAYEQVSILDDYLEHLCSYVDLEKLNLSNSS